MFSIIKNSYKFFIYNFPKILWIISGLLFLELGSRWLALHHNIGLWVVTVLALSKIVIVFTQIYVIIDLTELVLTKKIPQNENSSLIYMKVFGFTLLLNGTFYGIVTLIEYYIPEALLTSIIGLITQFAVVFFVFAYYYARLNIIIPMIILNQKLIKYFPIAKGRYTKWLLVALLIYQPSITLNIFEFNSYFLVMAKVFFFSIIYIFNAMYLKYKLDN